MHTRFKTIRVIAPGLDLDEALLQHPAFTAVLEAIPTAAFVVDAGGAIGCMNARGRAVVQADADAVCTALARLVRQQPGAQSFVLRTIGERGARICYLAVMTADDSPQARAHVLAERWGLTRRQEAVLAQLARGSCNKDISARLGCAEVTVEFHVTALLRKVGMESRAALIARFWTEESAATRVSPS